VNACADVVVWDVATRVRLVDRAYETLTNLGVMRRPGVDGFQRLEIRLPEIGLHFHGLTLSRDILGQFLVHLPDAKLGRLIHSNPRYPF
jgi:hypothetical protein